MPLSTLHTHLLPQRRLVGLRIATIDALAHTHTYHTNSLSRLRRLSLSLAHTLAKLPLTHIRCGYSPSPLSLTHSHITQFTSHKEFVRSSHCPQECTRRYERPHSVVSFIQHSHSHNPDQTVGTATTRNRRHTPLNSTHPLSLIHI